MLNGLKSLSMEFIGPSTWKEKKNNIFIFTNIQMKFSIFPRCECRQQSTLELAVPFTLSPIEIRHFHITLWLSWIS